MRTLYVCYFGLREPLVQTQVLPYLRALGKAGIEVCLLTFEPDKRRAQWLKEEKEWAARLKADDIRWFSLPYHKRPSVPATLYDIVAGALFISRLIRRHGIDVVHARSHIPMAMALLTRLFSDCEQIFDIRGLMADEYADAGIWMEGSLTFRAVKWLERTGIRKADQLVVLTERMRAWLAGQGVAKEKIEVIPCCVDSSQRITNDESCVTDHFEIVYAGSVTGLYLLEDMARFFLALRKRRPDAFFRVLTTSSPDAASDLLRRAGLDQSDFWIGAARPEEVPAYLRRAHLGISFRKQTFSQIAACPTKIPEYLAAGLPVVSSAGVGDMDHLLESYKVGVTVQPFDSASFDEAAESALALASDPELKDRCAQAVAEHFDLSRIGEARYLRVYQRIKDAASVSHTVAATGSSV